MISNLINYKGILIKVVSGNRIFFPAFGTTVINQSPHYSWVEIEKKTLKPEFLDFLREKGHLNE